MQPVLGGEPTECRPEEYDYDDDQHDDEEPVGHCPDIPLVAQCLQDPRVVVAKWDTRNLMLTVMMMIDDSDKKVPA